MSPTDLPCLHILPEDQQCLSGWGGEEGAQITFGVYI